MVVYKEAVAQRCPVKKVFLEISQNSQENNCDRYFFNKVAGLRPTTLFKKRLWYRCEISKNTFFHRRSLVAPTVYSHILVAVLFWKNEE